MSYIKWLFVSFAVLAMSHTANARDVEFDFSQQAVPEESGIRFEKITEDADCVSDVELVARNARSWWVGPQLALSPDGTRIAYINNRYQTFSNWMADRCQGSFQRQICCWGFFRNRLYGD